MNQGGEPGHDDYGLPRVDIEIPDDARELYRDVQAYHRELRALRRQQRSMRWRAPLRRSGIVVPLIAGCLVLAMITVMVLTMFSASPYFSPVAGQQHRGPALKSGTARPSARPSGPGHSGSAGPASSAAGRLPGKSIIVAGKPVALRSLSSTALAIVPGNCRCAAALGQLLAQARSAGVIVYLIGPRGTSIAELYRLATASAGAAGALLASDADNVLTSAYRPVGLTALLVNSDGVVTVESALRPGLRLSRQLQLLRPAG